MIKSFLKDSLIYTLPAILSRGIGIFLLPIYTRITSPDELGALELFIAFGNIIAITVALEISQGISRFIPESDGKIRRSYAFTGLIFTIVTYSLSIFACFLFARNLSILLIGSEKYFTEFKLALIYIFFNGFYYYFQNLLRFEGKSTLFSISSITYAALNLSLVFILGVILEQGFKAIFYSLILSSLFASILSYIFLRNSFEHIFRADLLKELLTFSIPLVPASVLVFVSLYIDRFMISSILGLEYVGVYSVGIKLSSAAGLLMIGFQMAITPLIYKHHLDPETPNSLSLIFKYFVILSLLFFASYSILAREVVMLLATPEFFEASTVLPSLVLAFLFSHMYVFLPGITIQKKTYIILVINLFVAFVNIALNMLLIPEFGIIGAAIASTFGYFLGFLLYIFFSQKYYYVQHNWKKYGINLLLSILILYSYFHFFEGLTILLDLSIKFLAITIIIFSLFLTKVITTNDLLEIRANLGKISK